MGNRAVVIFSVPARTLREIIFVLVISVAWVRAGHSGATAAREGLTTEVLGAWAMVADGDELATTFTIGDGVTVHVRAPQHLAARRGCPTRLVFYALPNGNTIAWTVGKRLEPGDDWHFGIQQIGAQTRHLRRLLPTENVVVAYLEAPGRSWPAWRRKHGAQAPLLAKEIVEAVAAPLALWRPWLELAGHSGGGSFLFAYLESADQISTQVRRLVFLDANYGFSEQAGHGRKLAEWLRDGSGGVLAVAAYDDRWVTLDGKPVVGPTGGTWRATERMIAALGQSDDTLTTVARGDVVEVHGWRGRFRVALHKNPQKRILHTVLVERNGFLWGLLVGSDVEAQAPAFFSDPVYLPDLLPQKSMRQ
ncbi:MAG: hypothetical protein N2Z21_02200 [Candidatus Sumerlaeaceae bacterium]|nr:hypothetical protein [Candidatus Sumerlaeaceae bacterium]